MKDQYGRKIDYMRISVTDRCNLRCVYCMPEEGVKSIPHDEILRFQEIERVCRAAVSLGIQNYKITGGEPLVRRNVESLIASLRAIPGIGKITMTTNGVLLADHLDALAKAGLDEVTISLDTTDPERFREITRRDELGRVIRSAHAVLEDGRIPLKINCVPLGSMQAEQLVEILSFARDWPVNVRFIEMMPIGLGKNFRCSREDELIPEIEKITGPLTPYSGTLGNGPAHYYSAEGYPGRIGFISAVSHRFCSECNRIRLTSDGFLKSCLQYNIGEDVRTPLRSGDDDAVREAILRAIAAKPSGHHFGTSNQNSSEDEKRIMAGIGG